MHVNTLLEQNIKEYTHKKMVDWSCFGLARKGVHNIIVDWPFLIKSMRIYTQNLAPSHPSPHRKCRPQWSGLIFLLSWAVGVGGGGRLWCTM